VTAGLATLLLGGVLAGQVQVQAPVPVFGVEVETVYIDAFVTHGDSPVLGLQAGDFELRDNGVVQRLELASADTQPVLAVMAFDMSNSLEGEKLAALRAAGRALLEALRPEDEATLFTFSDEVRWLKMPTTDKAAVGQALEQLQPGGGSPVMDALYAALMLPRSRGRTLVVLFTDGIDNSSWLDGRRVRLAAERSNAMVHVVSLKAPEAASFPNASLDFKLMRVPTESNAVLEFENPWTLRRIAEATGGRSWEADSKDRLKAAFTAIAEAMGRRYVLRYTAENVKRPGWHTVELKLRGKRGDVHTRAGYWVAGQ
jgi:VWFA-related protein